MFQALYPQSGIQRVAAWNPHRINRTWWNIHLFQKIWLLDRRNSLQQVHSKYGKICPYLGKLDRPVHYYSNHIDRYLFKNDFTIKLRFWLLCHCRCIYISLVLVCRYIHQWQSATSCLMKTCPCWWTNYWILFCCNYSAIPQKTFGINFLEYAFLQYFQFFSFDRLHNII